MLHIFIDESGDPGYKFEEGSSKYFVMGFAFFPKEDYKNSIDSIKSFIKSGSRKAPKEIKFNKSSHEVRVMLLEKLVENNGKFGYIYVDKIKIFEYLRYHPNINYIYNQMVFYLIENLIENVAINDNVTLYIDQRSKNKEIKKNLSVYLERQINPILSPHRLHARFEKSHNSRGVQCADCICGSVRRMVEMGNHNYVDIIRHNIVVRRQLFR
jgi:hypothetical protein